MSDYPKKTPVLAPTLTTKALKVTAVLNAVEIAALSDLKEGVPRVVLRIAVSESGGRTVTAEVAPKAVRKAKAVIAEHGVDGVVAIVQGKFSGAFGAILEAGLVVQPKLRKPVAAATAQPLQEGA